jgi:molybdate transport system regulatory protein
MEPKANFWIENDGEVVLSEWRVSLLEAVAETGSINAAAERMGIHYRLAWNRIREIEDRLGVKLTESQTGGSSGGGTRLTAEGREYIRKYRAFTDGLMGIVSRRFEETFGRTT